MRPRQESECVDAGRPEWSPAKLLATLAAAAVAMLTLVAGLVFAVVSGLRNDEPNRPFAASGMTAPPNVATPRDALAAAPMPSVDPSDALPGPIATQTAGVLELPRPSGPGPAEVPTGFPRTPAGALAQLAAIDVSAMETGAIDGVRRVIAAWAAPGGPTTLTWSGVKGMTALLSAVGLPGARPAQLTLVVYPVMGLIKGTVGSDFAVVCVDSEFAVTVEQTSRIAIADCQRMAWAGDRWLIGAGAEPAPAPSIWPGTVTAIAAGYRELRYV